MNLKGNKTFGNPTIGLFNFINIFVFLFLLLLTTNSFSQLSKTHYIPPLTSAEFGNANPEEQYIYLSTPSLVDIAYTIMPVGQPSTSYITGVVSNTNPKEIYIGSGNGQLFVASSQTSTITNKGYIIEAEDVIYTSIRMNAGNGAQAGALVSKGLSALGTTFRIGGFTNENPLDNYLNFASVMATEDNTQVTFSDLPTGLKIKNYSGSTPISITLNKGQSYIIATNSFDNTTNRDGLIGTLVSSDKNIVVNCGSANGSFHNGLGRDYGIDQIVGLSKVGHEYIFVKGNGTNDWENILLVAHSNNTQIHINGGPQIQVLNAGEYYLIEGDNYNSNGNMFIQTSEAVFAYQGIGATTSEANQGMFFVPPLSCETRGNLDNIANIGNIGNTTYTGGISIVTKKGATVTINNTPINNFNTIGPSDVDGNTNYVTYKVTGLSGNISVQSDDELYCAYFNYNGAATSGSFYSGFPTAPEINFDATFVTLGICIPNITLSVANGDNFDSFEWYFDDGTGYIGTGVTTTDYTPTVSGTYKLIGILLCSNLTLESLEVPVSICPDDIDNDGIIDNIDIDNDNDGILNCIESFGDQEINLSNTSGGTIPIGNYSFTSGITTQGNVASTPFNGSADGAFMSETPDKNGTTETSVKYNLSFNKTLNLRLEYATSSNLGNGLLTNDGEFIIQVPNTRTITLLDPDDQLLVDSNYDGVYETGITQISSFEIRFKLKGTSLAIGTGTFSFLANAIDNITYIHINKSETSSNQASFKISATCVPTDSDLDGIEDSLDFDSDNDGIPDNIEAIGTSIILSENDSNGDGLDDVFDINTMPLDSDLDGVFDFLDLDSDNDGIYDLEESNSLFPDSNFDGTVDNANSTIGLNGWVDAAETTPDSGLINYTIVDMDSDGTFNYIDNNSDSDNCFDVLEAGFLDANNDGYLGDFVAIVNSKGIITNASGYTTPNTDYIIYAPILIETQPIATESCELSNALISISSSTSELYQWEMSVDGIIWNTINDNSLYSNSKTNTLQITATPLNLNSYKYRVFLNRSGNACGLYSDEIELTIIPLPTVKTPNTYSQCDDISNDGIASFNLTLSSIKEEIAPNYIIDNLSFTYYNNLSDAENLSNAIVSPTNYQNTSPFILETVWIRIENSNECFRVETITLKVNPSSAALANYNPSSIYQCDDGIDFRNGLSTFDLTNIHDHISTTTFPTFNVSVHFYESLSDAELENNEIQNIANHQNTNSPNIQSIWVRVKSDLGNNCLGLKGFPNLLNVEKLPVAFAPTTLKVCDDNQDGIFLFDTATVELEILNGQNLTDISILYFDTIGNPLKDNNGTLITSPFPSTFLTTSQIINYTLTNNTTNDPNGACSDSNILEFIVDILPINNTVIIPAVCDPDPDDGLLIAEFDTSNIETSIGAQSGMTITYFDSIMNPLQDIDGNTIVSPFPNSFKTGTQTITIVVSNPNNSTCPITNTIDFVVQELPQFSVETPRIICESGPASTITLDVIQNIPSEVFDYTWNDSTGLFISNSTSIDITESGNYTATLTKTDGTGCTRTKEIIVVYSEMATIDTDDIIIVDDSDNNTITINAENNNLGNGDYEFSLDNEFGLYQDEPFFEMVDAGIHTIYIKDMNGCGTTSIEISVIGFPKFFTPNNDGYNDNWQVLGINQDFFPSSLIYIYDRFGKLIAKVDPKSQGWNGYYNGVKLPADDYWFSAQLIDSDGNIRSRKGHFSMIRR